MANYDRTVNQEFDEEISQIIVYFRDGVLYATVHFNDEAVELNVSQSYGNENAINLRQIRRDGIAALGYSQVPGPP